MAEGLAEKDDIERLERKLDEHITNAQSKFDESAKKENISKIFDRLDMHKEAILKLDTEVKILKTVIEPLKELPDILNDLKDSMLSFKSSLDSSNAKIDMIEQKVDENSQNTEQRLDSLQSGLDAQKHRGKIDIVDWLARNWEKIVIGIAVIYVFVTQTMKG